MVSNATARDDRIEIRATKEEKRNLVAAAQERLDVSSFIMGRVLPAARELVDEAERILLSKRDTERVRLLESPPVPTPALMDAVRRRRLRK